VRGKRGTPKKAGTLKVDGYRWRDHVIPLIGKRIARELTRRDVVEFLHAAEARAKRKGRSGAGERRLKGTLGGIMSWAVEREIIETNPCTGVRTRPDGRRIVALNKVQYRILGRALFRAKVAGEAWQAIEAIRLIALTGCRRNEVTSLRWSEVDIEGQALRLGDTKTGDSVRPLGRVACEALQRLQGYSGSNAFVFPAIRGVDGAYAGLPRAWGRITDGAITTQGGKPLTLHGLRHAFASVAASLNFTELTIAAMIGHGAHTITSRYAHAIDSVLLSAVDAVSESIATWLNRGEELAAFETPNRRGDEICVVADYPAKPDPAIESFLISDVLTKDLPADKQAALARSLGDALTRFGLPQPLQRRRGAKPAAWRLDQVVSDCEEALRSIGLGHFLTVRTDGVSDARVHQFFRRLFKQKGVEIKRKSLRHNVRRGRAIARHSLPATDYRPKL
jgi:integrase